MKLELVDIAVSQLLLENSFKKLEFRFLVSLGEYVYTYNPQKMGTRIPRQCFARVLLRKHGPFAPHILEYSQTKAAEHQKY